MNMFDGFLHFSDVAGRNSVILDGDFIRLNTFGTDEEKQSVISLQLMAGGPVTVADQYHTIGDNLRFYQNSELLALNTDRFVGKPLTTDRWDSRSQIWYGQLTNGDWVLGLFNREDNKQKRAVDFTELGIEGSVSVRDLWTHTEEGEASRLEVELPPHGCKIVKLSKK